MAAVRWPRVLSPAYLAALIRRQKDPRAAADIFFSAPLRYPSSYHRHTSAVYSAAVAALSPSLPRNLRQFRLILSHMINASSPAADYIFAAAISSLAAANLPADAVSVFESIPNSNCISYPLSFHEILKLLLSLGDLVAVRKLLHEFSGRSEVKFSIDSLNLIVNELCCLNRTDLALQVFGELREQCFTPNRESYRILMKGLCDSGRLEDAKHLLYSMLWRISQKGCEEDVVVYRLLLEALVDHGKIGEAEDILGKVLLKGLKSPKRRRAFMWPELRGRTVEDIKRLIDSALVAGGVRSSASYRAVATDLYAEGKIDYADRLFIEMVNRGFRPDVDLFEAKIAALCTYKRVGEAAKVLDVEMVEMDCFPRVQTYNLLIEAICKEGKAVEAIAYMDKIERQPGCVAAVKESYEILIKGLCCEDRFIEAAKVLERMLRRKHSPGRGVFGCVIQGLCLAGWRYEAVLWLEEMLSHGEVPDANVWNSLVLMLCPISCMPSCSHTVGTSRTIFSELLQN